ncbi:MAG: S41 family peptidase [Bacteroidota bacterium]
MRKYLIWVLVISLSFGSGFITNVSDNYFEISKNLDIFGKLYREINTLYVDDTDPSELMRTGIDAMLNSLDPYTNYISEKEVDDFKFMSTGQYGGVGALIGLRKDKFVILELYEGYPADRSGLKAGDEIISVDGKEVNAESMKVVDVRNLLRGEKGSAVKVAVKRNEKEDLDFSLERDRVKVNNVPYYGMVDENIGYIALTGFTQDAGKEVEDALTKLQEENAKLSGVVLDLRGNPGGRLDEAVNVANVFLPYKEKIVETRGRIDGSQRTHYAQRQPVDTKIPLAVVINKNSASASEIVAGSIQDLDRGIIIGQKSFGKGLVQNIRPLSYNTQLKVTTAKYYTPSGRCIQAINYHDKDKNGRFSRIPDSLRKTFFTRNGREVMDAGGISPDVAIDKDPLHEVSKALARQNVIFNFVTVWTADKETIANPREFKITDQIYNEFVAYVRDTDFSFKTKADRQLDRLQSTIEEEAYFAQISNEISDLEKKLESLKDKDLMKHKDEISRLLKQEILLRYYHQSGSVEGYFLDTPEVDEAVALLTNKQMVEKMLKMPNK